MNLETLQRAKCLESCIKSTNKNIETLTQLKDCKEIMIIANTSQAKEAIEDIYYNKGIGNLPPVYYSGTDKDAIIETIINRYKEFLNGKLNELEQL